MDGLHNQLPTVDPLVEKLMWLSIWLYQYTGVYRITVPSSIWKPICARDRSPGLCYIARSKVAAYSAQGPNTAIGKGERSRSGMTVFAIFQTMYAIAHGSF